MAQCSNCSAPIPPNSITCEYCGSRNDVDLKGIHYYTTHDSDSPRICPRCAVSLKTVNLQPEGRFLIERCDQCLGLFFDPGELEALLENTVSNVFQIDRARLNSINNAMGRREEKIVYLKCPVCSTIMNRVNFGTKSGVVVNCCKQHGVWLDGGGLRRLFEWMKAGGKLLHHEAVKEETRIKERELDRERRQQAIQSAVGGSYRGEVDSPFFGRTSDAVDIIDVVASVVRFFTR